MKIQKFKKRIGLFGFGCVGQGLYDVVEANKHLGLEIGRICVKDKEKPRSLPAAAFTYEAQDLLQDASLDLLVELISDPEEALVIVRQALQQGKTVVSANKKMVSENLPELISLQQRHGGVLLYEASVCGSIPILRTLEAYYGAEPLLEVRGILNGSSNYILSKLHAEKSSYAAALKQAQELGFAEADPSLDVEGTDALNKLCIIAAHAYGVLVHPDEVLHFGINHITEEAVALATSAGAKIKLIGTIRLSSDNKLQLQVIPTLLTADDALYAVDDEFNGVELEAKFAGRQLMKGRGAGGHPTGSAVWADIAAAVRGYRYTYPKLCVPHADAVHEEEAVHLLLQGAPEKLAILLRRLSPKAVHETGIAGQVIAQVRLQAVWLNRDVIRREGIFLAQVPEELIEELILRETHTAATLAV